MQQIFFFAKIRKQQKPDEYGSGERDQARAAGELDRGRLGRSRPAGSGVKQGQLSAEAGRLDLGQELALDGSSADRGRLERRRSIEAGWIVGREQALDESSADRGPPCFDRGEEDTIGRRGAWREGTQQRREERTRRRREWIEARVARAKKET